MNDKKLIIFIASNNTQAKSFVFVIKELIRRNKFRYLVISLDNYYHQNAEAAVTENSIEYIHAKRYMGAKPFWSCNRVEKVLFYFDAITETYKVIKSKKPDLLVLGNDFGIIEILFIRLAQKYNLSTLLIQDGILNSSLYKEKKWNISKLSILKKFIKKLLLISNDHRYGQGGCDGLAVMGEYSKKLLTKNGVPEENIRVTGQPRYDRLINIKSNVSPSDRDVLCNRYNIPEHKFILLFATQPLLRYGYWSYSEWYHLHSILLEGIQNLSDIVHLIIKVHPSDEFQLYKDEIGNNWRNLNVTYITNKDILDILPFVDFVTVYTSTVALEAMMFDKPVIIINPWIEPDYFEFTEKGSALQAHTVEEFSHQVKYLINTMNSSDRLTLMKKIKNTVEYHACNLDGLASSRIVDQMEEMIYK